MVSFLKGRRRDDDSVVAVDANGREHRRRARSALVRPRGNRRERAAFAGADPGTCGRAGHAAGALRASGAPGQGSRRSARDSPWRRAGRAGDRDPGGHGSSDRHAGEEVERIQGRMGDLERQGRKRAAAPGGRRALAEPRGPGRGAPQRGRGPAGPDRARWRRASAGCAPSTTTP